MRYEEPTLELSVFYSLRVVSCLRGNSFFLSASLFIHDCLLVVPFRTKIPVNNMLNLSLMDMALLCYPILAFLPSLYPKTQLRVFGRQSLLLYFLALLAFRYYTPSHPSILVQSFTASEIESCRTHDRPNPIAHLYSGNATGTLNGTITVLPIPLALARTLIPHQYGIITHAYRSLLPNFPADMYPAILQALHDHDVQAFGYKIPDFTRTGIEFPFLDMFGDGTSFKWVPSLLMSAGHEIALKGARDYGTNTFSASFDPPCDAYRNVHGKLAGTTSFSAQSTDTDTAFLSTEFAPVEGWKYPLRFFKNVTSQPTFADGKTCDNMIRLFNTSITASIETVRGSVRATIPPFKEEKVWEGVEGIRLDSAFIENNYLPCEEFKGYGGS